MRKAHSPLDGIPMLTPGVPGESMPPALGWGISAPALGGESGLVGSVWTVES